MDEPNPIGTAADPDILPRIGLARMDGVPLHRQLFLVLRSAIFSGRYCASEGFPTEEALVRSFQVSRSTVRRALSSLEGEGLIERRQGAATRVAAHIASYTMETSLAEHRKVVDDVASRTAIRSMIVDEVAPGETVRAALKIDGERMVTRIRRVRTIGDIPVWYTSAYFSPDVLLASRSRQTQGLNLLDLLERSGVQVGELDETIGAVLADPESAAQLEVGIGAPLLETITTVIDEAGNPVSFQVTLVPPERRRIRVARRSDMAHDPF